MNLDLAILTTLALGAALVDFAIGHRRVRPLAQVTPSQNSPLVSVVAAARNEARGIEAALRSVLRLDSGMIDGLMKNAFAGVDYSLVILAVSTVALLLMNLWPFVALLTTHGVTRALNGVSVMLIVLLFWTSTGYAGRRLGYVLAFPAAVLLFVYIMWRSALVAVVRGTVTWRGTAYPLAEMRANRV